MAHTDEIPSREARLEKVCREIYFLPSKADRERERERLLAEDGFFVIAPGDKQHDTL